jgi:hypothetical protein
VHEEDRAGGAVRIAGAFFKQEELSPLTAAALVTSFIVHLPKISA